MSRSLHIHRYRLPLVEPLATANGPIDVREGVVVGLIDSQGKRHVGEAAPLAPFVPESVDEVVAFFEALKKTDLTWLERPLEFSRMQRESRWPATCSAALETLHVSILRSRGGLPLKQTDLPVQVYGLAGSPNIAQRLVGRGMNAVKIKVPRADTGLIVAHIERFREALPEGVELRIDANQSWDFATAAAVLRAAEGLGVALVEEPLAAPTTQNLIALRGLTDIPLFADESIRSVADLRVFQDAFDGLVLKPMFVGGPFRALHLARHAEALGMACFVTTSLDAAIGRRMAAWTAQMLPHGSTLPHGLVTGRIFRKDIGPALALDEDRLAEDALGGWREFSEEVWQRCF